MSTALWGAAILIGLAILAVGAFFFLRMLAKRVVGVPPRRSTIKVAAADRLLILPRDPKTEAPGVYGIWFGEDFTSHARVGQVIAEDDKSVTRQVLKTTAALPITDFDAQWTGHWAGSPEDLGLVWRDVTVPLRHGEAAPAWFFPSSAGDSAPWAIHVQGIRTSRVVTLRAVEAAARAGYASLVITYHGAGDGPPAPASHLGLIEWTDLDDAVTYARLQGASAVTVIAWSMGAGLALEQARNSPADVDSLVLICPATDWRKIVLHGARSAHLPSAVGTATVGFLASPIWSRLVGLQKPIDFEELDWTRPDALHVPTLVIHSRGDEEIPFALSQAFAAAHPSMVTLVETKPAPHGNEPNVDPLGFEAALDGWLIRAKN